MARGLAIDDEAASSILGFITGLAVLTGSLAMAVYFMTSVPDTGSSEESKELEGATLRAIETLTTTPGQPANWGDDSEVSDLSSDQLRRVGLLKQGKPHYADKAKIERIQDGQLTGDRVIRSWDLNPQGFSMRAEGRVQSVEIGETPGVDTYGVAHGDQPALLDDLDWPIASHSEKAAELYGSVNPGYEYDKHHWEFGVKTDPSTGLGTTVPDHAWFVETQLIPKLAGFEATDSSADHAGTDWMPDSARVDEFEDYTGADNGAKGAVRWHVVAEDEPYPIPGNNSGGTGEHALGISYRRDQGGGGGNGIGQWRVEDGDRSVALLGKVDVDGAQEAELAFDQLLKVNNDGDECTSLLDLSCTLIRPSIIFWNTTGTDKWTRIQENPQTCNPQPTWDDIGAGNATGGDWQNGKARVDLCEALDHTGNELWLGFFWDVACQDTLGNNITCSERSVRSWFIDNVEVTVDGETAFQTDFEPPTDQGELGLFVSNGVDHKRTHAPARDHTELDTSVYVRHMVENGSGVTSLAPGANTGEGKWLSQVGLSVNDTSWSKHGLTDPRTETRKPENLVLRYPNDIPEDDPEFLMDNSSWHNGTPATPSMWSLPGNFQSLDSVHTDESGINATLLHGRPYKDGGRVVAISYNYTSFGDNELREELYENLHGGTVFEDPTFTMGEPLPEPGSVQVVSDRRVMLVGLTPDNRYVGPLEVTLWMWGSG